MEEVDDAELVVERVAALDLGKAGSSPNDWSGNCRPARRPSLPTGTRSSSC
jgi:hypothetical protein